MVIICASGFTSYDSCHLHGLEEIYFIVASGVLILLFSIYYQMFWVSWQKHLLTMYLNDIMNSGSMEICCEFQRNFIETFFG
jgi:hypothetical protein